MKSEGLKIAMTLQFSSFAQMCRIRTSQSLYQDILLQPGKSQDIKNHHI
jgi:hypothetical protein